MRRRLDASGLARNLPMKPAVNVRPTMGRTPLFRTLVRAVRQARVLSQNPQIGSLRQELPAMARAMRRGDPLARREFMRQAARIGLAAPVASGLIGRRSAFALPIAGSYGADPVAIIGAGAAGLTAAYRLMQAGVPCQIFEASTRVGGRIYTRNDFNDEHMFCELGAELVDSDHDALISLADELGVGIQELKEGDAGVDFFHFGGRVHTEADLIPAFQDLAAQIAKDQATLYEGEGEEEYSEAARALDQISIREYLQRHSSLGESWITEMLNVAYTGEYGRDSGEQSALNLLTYLIPDTSEGFKIFGDSDESKRVLGGNSTLMNAIAKAIDGKVALHLGHRLTRIAEAGSELELAFDTDGAAKTVKFGRVICSLPFTLLREIEGLDRLGLDPVKLACIRGLGYGTNVKVMYGFSERLWRGKSEGHPENNGSVYTELASQCFWETSRKQNGKSGILTNFIGGPAGLRPFNLQRFADALDDLDRIHPGLKAKHDGKKASWLWPRYEFSKGAYSCPLVGQVTGVWESAAEAELGGRLLFAGEHTSFDYGGFMNGAIETGNRCAAEILAS